MRITDIIMVSDNFEGITKNYIVNFNDLFKIVEGGFDNSNELAYFSMKLGKTIENPDVWASTYLSANKVVYARYCTSEQELKQFFDGFYDLPEEYRFDRDKCSKECLEFLKEKGINLKSKRKGKVR